MTSENSEDVSFGVVPGSVGTAGVLVVPWAPRRTPASDRVREAEMESIRKILPKPEAHRAPVKTIDPDSYREAVDLFRRPGRRAIRAMR